MTSLAPQRNSLALTRTHSLVDSEVPPVDSTSRTSPLCLEVDDAVGETLQICLTAYLVALSEAVGVRWDDRVRGEVI